MVFKLASHLIHRRFHAANPLLAKKITESLSWIRRLKEGSGQFCKHPSDQTFVLQDGSDQQWPCRKREELHSCSHAGSFSRQRASYCVHPASLPVYFICIIKSHSEMEFHASQQSG